MELAGLSLSGVLTVFGAFGAATVGLYLLRLRRRRVEVPFVDLWSEALSDERTSQLFSSLRRILSLLVSLAVVGLLSGALGDPRPARGELRTTVIVVDTSLSMQATDVAPTRFEAARAAVRELVGSIEASERMLLVTMDARPGPASPLTDDPVVLRAALDALEPTDTQGDVDRALHVALDALLDAEHGEIVLVTDGAWQASDETLARLGESGVTVRAILVGDGEARANVALTALAARRHPLDPSRAEVLVELLGSPEEDASVEVVLSSEGRTVDVLTLDVPAGARLRRFFEDVSGLDRAIEAHVRRTDGGLDLLPGDDHAAARIPERRRRRVAVVSDDNAFLEAALLLDELLEVRLLSPTDARPEPGDVDVTILDGVAAPSPLTGPTLWLAPPTAAGGSDTAAASLDADAAVAGPVLARGTALRPRFDRIDRDHPLVRWVSLRDVNVASATLLVPEQDDEVVAGDAGVPLLVTGLRGGHRFVAVAFDVRQSDLPLRVAWPVLLLDALELLAPDDARAPSSHRAGERFSVLVPRADGAAELVSPGGVATPVTFTAGRLDTVLDRAGLYVLSAGDHEDIVAVSPASGAESILRRPESLDLGTGTLNAPSPRVARAPTEPWQWLVLAALVVLAVEIVTYHRRVSV